MFSSFRRIGIWITTSIGIFIAIYIAVKLITANALVRATRLEFRRRPELENWATPELATKANPLLEWVPLLVSIAGTLIIMGMAVVVIRYSSIYDNANRRAEGRPTVR